jgi:hypothetical protein
MTTTYHAAHASRGGRVRAAWRATGRAFVGAFKRLLVAAVTVAIIFGFVSPLWIRWRLNGVATTTARAAAQSLASSSDTAKAHDAAVRTASAHDAHLDDFSLASTTVKVTVSRHAPSLGLDRAFSSWYDVRVTASAVPH